MNTLYRNIMSAHLKPILNRFYHGTSVAYKYSYLNDMTKLRNPFDESHFKKFTKWFTDSPTIDVDPVDDMEIWGKVGGRNPDTRDKKEAPQK